ncbi:hypothetical protein A7C99_6602 [Trichophyton rubrum]|uniref:Uncharacterized protein n=2 Tax=Trichophyton rubrum TaxID=5551 RepID=A0A178EPQ8_TRIRU|nr:uncharacterized protein TERG_03164 [Trichophyton rubrum CBS 118892]EGD86909.1 hypothetical protein TERG_03164 [Trichophyton rubrum CBS 118892]KMQ49172.1 hypothetical protein HL42_0328 [Trichophyton rubrum]OAL62031.1 hypothetical protein A7C99_6602 [Trichophyton rubrum]
MSSTAPPSAHSATKSKGRVERSDGEECDPEEDKAEIKRHIAEVEGLIREGYEKWGLRQIKKEKKKAEKRESKEIREKIKERNMESKRLLKMQKEADKEWRRELRKESKEERKRVKEKEKGLKKELKMEKKMEKMKREWKRERRGGSWRTAEDSEQEASIASDCAVFNLRLD